MDFWKSINHIIEKSILVLMLNVFIFGLTHIFAQEPMIGEQNGEKWKSLVIGI